VTCLDPHPVTYAGLAVPAPVLRS